jgi:hypothetical protein
MERILVPLFAYLKGNCLLQNIVQNIPHSCQSANSTLQEAERATKM